MWCMSKVPCTLTLVIMTKGGSPCPDNIPWSHSMTDKSQYDQYVICQFARTHTKSLANVDISELSMILMRKISTAICADVGRL